MSAQTIPLFVPLGFMAFWLLLLFVNRDGFRDPEAYLREMANKRSASRVVRALGGSPDPEVEFPGLWKGRWLWPIIGVLMLGVIIVMLAVSISQM